ncbi:hypothetical protein FACS1894127_6330 [Clostridia bacterium]|nr:hypothetical protein FACS1894127_6330 [Clostridia bacterium]
MNGTYVQKGESLDYVNKTGKTIIAGEALSLGSRIGVAGTTMTDGQTGSVHVVGVFLFPKATGALVMGDPLYYDVQGGVITKTATGNIPAGYAAAPAVAGDQHVVVKLLG